MTVAVPNESPPSQARNNLPQYPAPAARSPSSCRLQADRQNKNIALATSRFFLLKSLEGLHFAFGSSEVPQRPVCKG